MLYKYVKQEVVLQRPQKPKKKSNIVHTFGTGLCLFIGISILLYSFYPYINEYVNSVTGNNTVAKNLLSPSTLASAPSTTARLASNEDFNSNYVSNVNRNFSATNKLLNISPKTHPEYANIQGMMYLTIPKLKYTDIPVKVNVDSFDDKVYLKQLDQTLAHFQGTSLPDKPGNTFIYGHSANPIYAKTNPLLAFSYLDKLDIGDEIIVKYNDKEYKYYMQNQKLVTPNDISPIYTTSNAKTLTFMTCWAPGIGEYRLIVTAKQAN